MDLGRWVRRMSCDGLGVGQEDVMWWIWDGGSGGCHVMDLGWWVRRMSCDGFGVGQEDLGLVRRM